MSLRILLVHERFAPDFAGGGEYVVLEVARHLQALGHRIEVLTCGDPATGDFEGIRVTRLPRSRYRLNFAWREVVARARDVDVIQTFSYHAMRPSYLAARRLDKPVVACVLALFGDVWQEMRGPLVGRGFQWLERHLLDLPVDRRVFLSDASLSLAHAIAPARPRDIVVEPGISLTDYRAASPKNEVLFSGKLDFRKGIDAVLAAARRLPDVPFRIIGWGDRYAEVDAARSPNVILERFSDRLQMARAMSHASVFVFPSKAETFGLVVAEAMASGCAVISTLPLPFEGIRLRGPDADDVTAAVARLWADESLRTRAGEANVRIAQQYSWPRHVGRLEEIYREAIACRSRKER